MTAKSQYVTGYWSGEIYQDSVAAVTAPPLSAEVKLVAIDSQEQFFQTIQCGQGVLGFARCAQLRRDRHHGLLRPAHRNGGGRECLWNGALSHRGTLWLGGYDPTATTGPPQYIPFAISPYSSYYYVVKLASITVLGNTVPVATAQYSDTIVDTGTNAFIVPTAAYVSITATITASPAFAEIFGADAGTFFSLQSPADAGSTDASGDIDAGVTIGQACATLTQTKAELDSALPPLTLTFGSNTGVSVQATATESRISLRRATTCGARRSRPSIRAQRFLSPRSWARPCSGRMSSYSTAPTTDSGSRRTRPVPDRDSGWESPGLRVEIRGRPSTPV